MRPERCELPTFWSVVRRVAVATSPRVRPADGVSIDGSQPIQSETASLRAPELVGTLATKCFGAHVLSERPHVLTRGTGKPN